MEGRFKSLLSVVRCLNTWYLFVFFVGIGIFIIGMPKGVDDYWFMEFIEPWYSAQGIDNPESGGNIFAFGIPWSQIAYTWKWHYLYDNMRLGNILAPLLLLFPKWLGSSLMLLSFVYSVMKAFSLVNIDWKRSLSIPWVLVFLYLSLPLYNHFGTLVFQLNYIPSTALAILLLSRILGRRVSGRFSLLVDILIAIVLSLWQEAISLPVTVALFVRAILYSEGRRNALITAGVLCVGTLVLMLAPGMQDRAERSLFLREILDKNFWIPLISLMWSCFLVFGVLTASSMIPRIRYSKAYASVWVPLGAACLANVFLICFVGGGQRVGWIGCFVSPFLFFAICRRLFSKHAPGFRYAMRVSGLVVIGVMSWSLGLSAEQVFHLRPQILAAVDKFSHATFANEIDHVYVDVRYLGNYPRLLNRFPVYESGMNLFMVKEYYFIDAPYEAPAVIPTSFRDFSYDKGTPIPGKAGAVLYYGEIVMPYDGKARGFHSWLMEIDFGKGEVVTQAMGSVFVSDTDGKRYLHIVPGVGWYISHFKTIKAVGNAWPID